MEECEVGIQVVALRWEVEFAQAVEALLRAFVHLERQDQGLGHADVRKRAQSYLRFIFRLRGALAAGEGEVGFGVVGADPTSLYDSEAEGEAAAEREHRG